MLTAQQFNRSFCARTQQIRDAAGFSQADVAEMLDIGVKTYAKYETRSPMPHRFIPRFCKFCRVTVADLFLTGATTSEARRRTAAQHASDKAA